MVHHAKIDSSWLLYATILLLGLNLRPIMASVGPLMDEIQIATGLSAREAGLLTTIPVFVMGWAALFGGVIASRLGVKTGVTLACLLIALATLARAWVWSVPGLLVTAALGGLGIAAIQVLLPIFIKDKSVVDPGRGMALLTTGIMAGAALSSATTAPLADMFGWQAGIALWGALAVLAMIVWRVPRRDAMRPVSRGHALPWRSARAWYLLIFFGIGTAAYTLVLAWLPPYYTRLGWTASASGLLLGGLTLCEVVSGFVLTSVVSRLPDRRPILAATLGLACLGLAMLAFAPTALAIPAIIALGFAIGGLFPLSLIVSLDHLEETAGSGALMGFVQGGGYILASLMPFVAGFIRANTASLQPAWLVMLAGLLLQLMMVPRLRRGDRLDPRSWRLVR